LSAATSGAALAALHPAGLVDCDGRPAIDRLAAERAVRDLLTALGRDVGAPGLRETPRRVAAAFSELLTHEPVSLTTFPNDAGYDELVVVREIPFHSLRGVQKAGTRTTTSALLGLLRDDARTRQEFLSLVRG
jgi:GTP cyclohydrolase I